MMKQGTILKKIKIYEVWDKPQINDPKAKLIRPKNYAEETIFVDVILLEIIQEEYQGITDYWLKILYLGNLGWICLTQYEFDKTKTGNVLKT